MGNPQPTPRLGQRQADMREPGWWYGDEQTGWAPAILAPLGWAYGALTARRMRKNPRHRAGVPVVCIDNFTAGGTGKTPFVVEMARLLRGKGHTPAVLTRGFGGSVSGPHWVDAQSDTADRVGDEPLLLAAHLPVMLARDRAAGARAIEAEGASLPWATVIIMDDGIQNPALAKDLTIAVVDGGRGIGNGRCIPAGPLRAPLAVQMPRVDALLFNGGTGKLAEAKLAHLRTTFHGPVLSATVAPQGDLSWLRDGPVIAYAGIGVPERFFASIKACGGDTVGKFAFPDHHPFSEIDAQRLLALSKAKGAALLTTEKDHARLAGQRGVLAELRTVSRTLPIRLRLDADSAAVLDNLIAIRLSPRP